MGTGWREVAGLAGRAFGALAVVVHAREQGRWEGRGWATQGDLPPSAIVSLEGRDALVEEVIERRVVLVEQGEGLAGVALPESAMAVFVALHLEPGDPVLAFICLPDALPEERLHALTELVGLAACRPSCRYRQFLERFPAAFLVVDERDRITYCNPFFVKLGYEPGELLGREATSIFPTGEWERLRRGAEERNVNRFQTMVLGASGGLVAMDFMASLCREPDGGQSCCLTVGCDERVDRQLGHYRRLEAVDRMVSGVAHELNNPLQTVVGNAEMLSGMKLSDAAHRRAGRVLAGARRCQEVVDGLLKLKRKRRRLAGPVALEDVVRRVARKLEGELVEQGASLKVRVVDPVPDVTGDASELEQGLENVVQNALQAVAGRDDGEVELALEGVEQAVRLTITDNGEGMSPDVRERAFEPFFTTRAVGAGKGLGLSIALGIIEEHGGLIELQPRPRGTRVVLTLPAAAG